MSRGFDESAFKTPTEEAINARVARGAALLDQRIPGWDIRIDVAKLYMGQDDKCLLAQLFPRTAEEIAEKDGWRTDYHKGLGYLFDCPKLCPAPDVREHIENEIQEHGFVLVPPTGLCYQEFQLICLAYISLNDAWKKELTQRITSYELSSCD